MRNILRLWKTDVGPGLCRTWLFKSVNLYRLKYGGSYVSTLNRIPDRGSVHQKLDDHFTILLLAPRVEFLDRINHDVNTSAGLPRIGSYENLFPRCFDTIGVLQHDVGYDGNNGKWYHS